MTLQKKASLRFLIVSLGALLVASAAVALLMQRLPEMPRLRAIWETTFFNAGNVAVSPSLLFAAAVFLIFLTMLTRFTRRLLRTEVFGRIPMEDGHRYALERSVGYAVFAMGLFVGMQMIGLDMSSLAFMGGAVGLGIGFGLQNIASNFASGLILLFERPLKIGDRIEVGSLNGDVVRIGGRSTWVRTNDNLTIIVPNSEFTTNRVTNWTANDRQVRFSFPVGVAYGSDPEKVRDVLLSVAKLNPDVLEEPGPEVLLSKFGDSSIDFELRVWTIRQVQTPSRLKSALYFEVVRQFAAHGITIPFPQRDVYIKAIPEFRPAGRVV